MTKKFLTPIGIFASSSAPSTTVAGSVYYNTSDNLLYSYSGSSWSAIGANTAFTRYVYNASGGETSISGADANGSTLSYTAGREQVFVNGVLLVKSSDYTATNGTSVTGLTALTSGDVVEVFAYNTVSITQDNDQAILAAQIFG